MRIFLNSTLSVRSTKNPSSMTKLHYVGFNGYNQCPKNDSSFDRILQKWTSTEENGTIIACTHRFVVLETPRFFKIYGVLNESSTRSLQVLTKPAKVDNFGSCEEFMMASSGMNIWRYNYRLSRWKECEFEFAKEEDKSFWESAGNRILKFSFQQNQPDVILLLSNGSVWLLSEKDKLVLLFPNELDKAIDVASGLEHSLILTETGCVLACGSGSRGQLGLGDLNPSPELVQITALEGLKVTKIALGGWHSCAVTDSGDLYMWGWNNNGQLSAFEGKEEIGLTTLPMYVETGEEPEMKVVDVACGRRHTIASLENGDLYSTGWNAYSQLGIEQPFEKVTKFTKCSIQNCQNGKIICGPWYTILVEDPVR